MRATPEKGQHDADRHSPFTKDAQTMNKAQTKISDIHHSPFTTHLTGLLIIFTIVSHAQPSLDPGRYDDTWWNRAPYRLVQTNLREIDATMDTDAYVQSMVDASVTVVLLNVGGIVANYPTKLPYQFRNPYMKGDLVGDLVKKLHAKEIK